MPVLHGVLQACVLIVLVGGIIAAWRLQSMEGVLSTIIVCTASAIVIRVVCELFLVIFRIYDVVRDIRRNGIRVQGSAAGAAERTTQS